MGFGFEEREERKRESKGDAQRQGGSGDESGRRSIGRTVDVSSELTRLTSARLFFSGRSSGAGEARSLLLLWLPSTFHGPRPRRLREELRAM